MVKISKRDLAVIAGLAGAADFLAEGRFTAPLSRALKTVIRRGGPAAARFTGATALRAAGTVATVGKTIAMRHPVLTTGAVVYYTYKNRDELGDLIEQGYEIIQPKVQQFGDIVREEFAKGPQPIGMPFFPKRKKVKTKFNSAVSKGMKVVKASTSYGKKGSITNAKKAFSVVTKTASRINKGAKVAKSGITRKIGLAIKGILK